MPVNINLNTQYQKKISEKYWLEVRSNTWNELRTDHIQSMFMPNLREIMEKEIQETKKNFSYIKNLGISLSLTNDFEVKAFEKSLPKVLTPGLFEKIYKASTQEEKNSNLYTSEQKFSIVYAMLKKYPFKEIVRTKQFNHWDMSTFFDITMNVKYYKKMFDLNAQVIEEYIKMTYQFNESPTMFLIPFVYAFVYMDNLQEYDLYHVMKRTKEDFKSLMSEFSTDNELQNIVNLYTPRGLKSKDLIKEIKRIVAKKYFPLYSGKYKTLPAQIRKEIADNFFEQMYLEQTIYLEDQKYEIDEEPTRDDTLIPLYNKVAKVFDFKERL